MVQSSKVKWSISYFVLVQIELNGHNFKQVTTRTSHGKIWTFPAFTADAKALHALQQKFKNPKLSDIVCWCGFLNIKINYNIRLKVSEKFSLLYKNY